MPVPFITERLKLKSATCNQERIAQCKSAVIRSLPAPKDGVLTHPFSMCVLTVSMIVLLLQIRAVVC